MILRGETGVYAKTVKLIFLSFEYLIHIYIYIPYYIHIYVRVALFGWATHAPSVSASRNLRDGVDGVGERDIDDVDVSSFKTPVGGFLDSYCHLISKLA